MKQGMYSKEEVKEYLENKGYSWDSFIEFMRGQTYSVIEGVEYYNSFDVERFRDFKK